MITPTFNPIFNPTVFDFTQIAFSAPGVRPRWVYVPTSVYEPAVTTRPDLIKGMTIFYGAKAAGEQRATTLAVLHPTDPERASTIGWGFDTLQMEGDDAPQVISQARGQRCWWIIVEDSTVLQGLIDLATARDTMYEEQALSLSRARASHSADISTIGDALKEKAGSREWCSEYDEFVEDLNRRLTYDLPLREREFDVEIEATYRMTVSVTATTEDDALRMAEDRKNVDHDNATVWTLSEVNALDATEQG